ncbi:hypothetical protein BH24ACT15_BH24ACT15_26540 [soil metagenome]
MTPVEHTDIELVHAVVQRDVAALRELHGRHAPWVRARLARRCADPGLVDEAVQDTFVAVWKSAHRFEPRGEVAAWVWGIAIRRLISALRRPSSRWTVTMPGATRRHEPSAEDLALLSVRYSDAGHCNDWPRNYRRWYRRWCWTA